MGKRHIITIAGDLGSGKSTAAKLLQRDLDYEIYKNGDYVRKLAKDKGMSIVEFQEYLNNHPEVDLQIEESAKEYAKEHDNLIIDARLGFYSVPESFKIYLKVDLDLAASRVFNDPKRKETETFKDIEQAKEYITYRSKEESERFFNLYSIRKEDMSNYDFVLDTTGSTPENTNDILLKEYEKWLNS